MGSSLSLPNMGVPLFGNNMTCARRMSNTLTALTDDGIDKLKDTLRDARIAIETWHAFHDDLVNDQKICIKAQSPR